MARFARKRGWVMRALVAALAVAFAMVVYTYVTLPDVRQLARTNPTSTAFMELRAAEASRAGRKVRQVQRWMPYRRISPHL